MARKTKSLSFVKGRRLRVTRLDGCGRPVYGDDSVVISKGFISVAFTANTTESDEIVVTNASGERCVYEASETSLTGYGIEMQFCEVDPELFALVTGQPVVYDADDNVIGLDIDTEVSLTDSGFSLELWAGSAKKDACDTEGAQGSYGYLLLPFLRGGIVGDFTVENAAVTFTLANAQTRNGNAWGVGPFQDVQVGANNQPGPMLSPIGSTTALRLMIVDVSPPEALTGARPLMDPTATPLLTVVAAPVADELEVDFTVTPLAIDTPVWYDFGDGTWDYTAADADGETNHVYGAPGTYTVRATSDGLVWRTTTATVPGA